MFGLFIRPSGVNIFLFSVHVSQEKLASFFLGWTRFASFLCAPSLLLEGAYFARLVQDEISIVVFAVTSRKHIKACTSGLTGCYSSGFFSRVCPLFIVLVDLSTGP